MKVRNNGMSKRNQIRLLEITALVSLFLLIVLLSHINLVSENRELEAKYNAMEQENTSMKTEIEKNQSEIAGLEWQLEQEKAKKQ